MAPITKETLDNVEDILSTFIEMLDTFHGHDINARRLLKGSLLELLPHYIIRSVPRMASYDIDQVIMNYQEPVAILSLGRRNKIVPLYITIGKAMSIPVYFVQFDDKSSKFTIRNEQQQTLHVFNRERFETWVQKVSSKQI